MPEYEMIRCDTHGIDIPKVSKSYAEAHGLQYGCQQCRDDLAGRPPAEAMSREDRAKEMHEVLNAHCMAGFDAVWDRVNVLVGRSTYTHELAYPDYLEHEIMTGSVPSTEGIIAKLPTTSRMTALRAGDRVFVVKGPWQGYAGAVIGQERVAVLDKMFVRVRLDIGSDTLSPPDYFKKATES